MDATSFAMQQHPKQCELICNWASKNKVDAVIWTALESNFSEPDKAGVPFTPKAAAKYVDSLEGDALKGPQVYKFDRMRDVEAIARILVEPPVEIRWSSFVQKLEVISNPHVG